MSLTNSSLSLSEQGSSATFNLDNSTLDLLNAAIASHSSSRPSLQLTDTFDTDKQQEAPGTTKAAKGMTVKRTIDGANGKGTTQLSVGKRAGRKPLERTITPSEIASNPKLKRKAQNRNAQRAFRERKERHVSELEDRIKELEALVSKADDDLVQENNKLKDQLKQLQDENYALKGAKFTFEFPASEEHQQPCRSNDTTSAHLTHQDDSASTTGSTEQPSPTSLNQEDDSDTTASNKTPPSLFYCSSAFLPFSAGNAPQEYGDIPTLANRNDGIGKHSYDFKDLLHNKDDLFNNHPAPPATTTDDLEPDNFLMDNSILPDLFGGTGDMNSLFGFAVAPQEPSAPFSLDQFYMPDDDGEPKPHLRKETLAAALQRASNDGVHAFEVHEKLKDFPDFNLDALCDELKTKATCNDNDYVLTDYDVGAYLKCFGPN